MRVSPKTQWTLCLVGLSLVASLGACGGTDAVGASDTSRGADVYTPPELDSVVTLVSAQTIAAGSSTTVSCEGFDQYGDAYPSALSFEITAGNGQAATDVVIDGDAVTIARAGVYRARCFFDGLPRVQDLAPPLITVTAGAPATLRTSLFITDLEAGETANVGCTVKDAAGNATPAETTILVAGADFVDGEGVTVNRRAVTFETSGDFTVVCKLVDDSLIGDDPIDVSVAPGRLRHLRTALSKSVITPGERVDITCFPEDAWGNAVEDIKVFTLPVGGVDFLEGDRLAITSTLSGTYSIACTPKESWWHPTEVPAPLTVNPGSPASIRLDLSPERAVFNLGARATVRPAVFDAWDNPIPDVADTLDTQARHQGALQQTVAPGDKVTFDAEGTWNLSVSTGAPYNLSASRVALCDASAPTIRIDYPPRGGMVVNDGTTINVSGQVLDATGGLAAVSVNGSPQSFTPGTNTLNLALPIYAAHGLNTLVIEAEDVNGLTTIMAMSYISAPGYKKAGSKEPRGLIVNLARDMLDDGDRSGSLNDLATIFERVIGGFNVASFIPSPAVTYAGYDIYLKNLRYDPPSISLAPAPGKLVLGMLVENMSIEVDADGFIDVGGDVTIEAIDVNMDLHVSVVNGRPVVTTGATVVDVQNLNIDVHWSINWLINFFEDRVEQMITDAFVDELKGRVPAAVEDALAALKLDQTFTVPAFLPGMEPINLRLRASPSSSDIDEQGLELAMATSVTTVKRVPWAAPGAMLRGGCFGTDAESVVWDPNKRLGFALSMDVLNQVLFAVWYGGALEITLGEAALGGADLSSYGVSDLDVTISGHMPPILTDCGGAGARIQIGEMAVDASLKMGGLDLAVGMLVAFEAAAEMSVDADGNLGLTIGEIAPEDILIDIVSVDSALFDDQSEAILVNLLREQLLAKVLEDFAGQSLAGFPLPEIDLGLIMADLEGEVIKLNDISLNRERGYFVLNGTP